MSIQIVTGLSPDQIVKLNNIINGVEHHQTTPSQTWTVVHNMGKYPQVTVTDDNRKEVWAEVDYQDINTVIVNHTLNETGWVFLT